MSRLTVFLFFLSLAQATAQVQLKAGDILFEDIDCGPLCEAIRKVTEGHKGRDFAHCALVVQSADTLAVVEAIGNRVQMNAVSTFMARATRTNGAPAYAVGRMRDNTLVPVAAAFAKARVGEPYDDPFIPDNGRWYCSELIQVAYREANGGKEVFPSAPMTFNDPATGQFFPVWVDYYRDIGYPIPEGIPGINPGLMSRSEQLRIVGE